MQIVNYTNYLMPVNPHYVDYLLLFCIHDDDSANGGTLLLNVAYTIEIIKLSVHNTTSISVSGNTGDGIMISTNISYGSYNAIRFGNVYF